MPSASDLELLDRFLGIVHEVLEDIVSDPRERLGSTVWSDELEGHLKNAWPQLEAILNRSRGRFMAPEFLHEDDEFRRHGLVGDQLAFKVGVVEALAVGWRQTFGSQKRGWLKKILDAIDALLDSLAEIVPGLGSVKEIKESLESLVED
jgi:hypothetical protein